MSKELYPGQRAELRAKQKRDRDASAAAAVPLPGPLADAFANNAAPQFTALTCGHIAILQEIDSPLLAMAKIYTMPEGPARDKALAALPFSDAQAAEVIFTFTHYPPQLRAVLRGGLLAYRETACARVLDHLPPGGLARIVPQAIEHFAKAFSTRLEFDSGAEGEQVFQTPPASTASAGGSTSTAS